MDKFTENFMKRTKIKQGESQAKRDYFRTLLTQNAQQDDDKSISDGRAAALMAEIDDRAGFAFETKISQEGDPAEAANKLMLYLIFLIWTRLDEEQKIYLQTATTTAQEDYDYGY